MIEFESPKEPIDFNHPDVLEQLRAVQKEIDKVLESAKVDPVKLAGLKEKLAIECMEDLSKEHNIPFNLRFNPKQRRWSVTVMSNTVNDSDFILAVRKAFEIVLKAKTQTNG